MIRLLISISQTEFPLLTLVMGCIDVKTTYACTHARYTWVGKLKRFLNQPRPHGSVHARSSLHVNSCEGEHVLLPERSSSRQLVKWRLASGSPRH